MSLDFLLLLLLELCDVEALVDDLGDGADLRAELVLDPVQGEAVVVRDEVEGDAEVAEAAGPTDAVEVGLRHLGEVEVDDDVDCLDVDAAGEEVAADQVPAQPGAEVVEHSVAMSLGHFGVNVVAGVTQLCDLFGQQLHSLCRVAEDNALVDL